MVPVLFSMDMFNAEEKPSMAYYELYPIVMACVLLDQQWKKKRILFHCDNWATVEIIHKGRSKIKPIMNLMRKRTSTAANLHFTVHAYTTVPGKLNTVADAISRFQMDKFRKLAPEADILSTTCPPYHQITMWKKKRLWVAAISTQITRAYSTGIQHLVTFVNLCGVALYKFFTFSMKDISISDSSTFKTILMYHLFS